MAYIDRVEQSVKEEKKRSLAANKYRWGVLTKTVMMYLNEHLKREGCEYRMTLEDADFFIKQKALGIAHIIPTSLGDIIITGRLKTRSKGDFEEAMAQIRAYFAQEPYFLELPLPNEDLRPIEEQYSDNLR